MWYAKDVSKRRWRPCCPAKSWKPISKKEDIEYHLDEEDPDRILVIFQTRQLSNVSLDITVPQQPHRAVPVAPAAQYPERIPPGRLRIYHPRQLRRDPRRFELNLDDGDLNYKIVGALGRENEIDREAFCRLLYLGNSMLDKYAPGILAILYGGKNAEEAYRSITKSNGLRKVRDKTMAFDLKQVAKYYKEDMDLNFALEEEQPHPLLHGYRGDEGSPLHGIQGKPATPCSS